MRNFGLIPYGSKQLLYSKLADKICGYITEEKLDVGARIPSERALAARWGVSRASLREAIRELENQGVLSVEVGRGTFVAEGFKRTSVMITVVKKNFLELLEVKAVLEQHIIQSLTRSLPREKLEELRVMAIELNESMESGIYARELDQEFHKKILDSYENQEMASIIWNLISIFAEFDGKYFQSYEGFQEKYNQIAMQTIPYHLEMVEAMLERNEEKAQEAYWKIIDLDQKMYEEALQ